MSGPYGPPQGGQPPQQGGQPPQQGGQHPQQGGPQPYGQGGSVPYGQGGPQPYGQGGMGSYGAPGGYGVPGPGGYQGYGPGPGGPAGYPGYGAGQGPGQPGGYPGDRSGPGQGDPGRPAWGGGPLGPGAPGGPGPSQQGRQPRPSSPARPPRSGAPLDLGRWLPLAVAVLALLNVIFGFLSAAKVSGSDVAGSVANSWYLDGWVPALLATAGALSLAPLMPKGGRHTFLAATLSVAGGVGALFVLFSLPSSASVYGTDIKAGGGLILLVVFGLLQAAVAELAWLVESGLIKPRVALPGGAGGAGGGSIGGPGPSNPQGGPNSQSPSDPHRLSGEFSSNPSGPSAPENRMGPSTGPVQTGHDPAGESRPHPTGPSSWSTDAQSADQLPTRSQSQSQGQEPRGYSMSKDPGAVGSYGGYSSVAPAGGKGTTYEQPGGVGAPPDGPTGADTRPADERPADERPADERPADERPEDGPGPDVTQQLRF